MDPIVGNDVFPMNYGSEQLSASHKLCIMAHTKDIAVCNILHNLNFLAAEKIFVIADLVHTVRDGESDARRVARVFGHQGG